MDAGMVAGTAVASSVNGVGVTGFADHSDGTYSYAYTYTASEGDADRATDALPVSMIVKDPAGNEGVGAHDVPG